jgi:hypothetical protein
VATFSRRRIFGSANRRPIPVAAVAAAFDPSTGFPWNQDAGESFVQLQFWQDDTPASFVGVPLNAILKTAWSNDTNEGFVLESFRADDTPAALGTPPFNVSQKAAWDGDSEVPPYVPGQDDTPAPFVGAPLNVTQLTAWAVEGGEVQQQPGDDPSVQSWAVGPPLNAVALSAFNGDSDVPPNVTTEDPSVQSWAVQVVGAAPVFDPSTGFPWAREGGEVVATPTVDDTIPPFVGVPLNATSAQAFNQPDEATFAPVTDDTAQPYSIQPVAAAGFDPSTGFPWPKGDDIVQPVWAITDDTAQAWTPQPIPFVGNVPQDVALEPWMVPDDLGASWIAAQGGVVVVTGGHGPDSGSAYNPTAPGYALSPVPGGSATGPTPSGSATSPRPQR